MLGLWIENWECIILPVEECGRMATKDTKIPINNEKFIMK